MKIVMMTNTYTPLVGGLERSVRSFTDAYRRSGERVVVVAPVFRGMPKREPGVIRVPAIPNVGGSPFSMRLPVPGLLASALERFRPDIVHAHHPFLMGDTALRVAAKHGAPLVFTHHTLFEQYTHYLPLRTAAAERFVIELATGYANLCDHVFAPSESVAELLSERGVIRPIDIVPTGVELRRFAKGNRRRFLRQARLPADAFVIGHLGRLAPEKNLRFLARAVVTYLRGDAGAWFVVAGDGPSRPMIERLCRVSGVGSRLRCVGTLRGDTLADAYHAMDVFAFASKSETQGLVLIEAMAAGVPVVALDAPGVREVLKDTINGRLVPKEDIRQFVDALAWVRGRAPAERRALRQGAAGTAEEYSMPSCAKRALTLYESIRARKRRRLHVRHERRWTRALRRLHTEFSLLRKTTAATRALFRVPDRAAEPADEAYADR